MLPPWIWAIPHLDSNLERLRTGYSLSTLPVKPAVMEPTTSITTPIKFLKSSAVLNESHVDSDTDSAAEVGKETVHMWTEFLPFEPVLEPVQVSMENECNNSTSTHPATVCTNQTDEDPVPLPPLSCLQEITMNLVTHY